MKNLLLAISLILAGACSSNATSTEIASGFELPEATTAKRNTAQTGDIKTSDIVREVLARNPSAAQAAAAISQAQAQLKMRESAFRPQLNFQFSYMLADAPSAYLFKTIDARSFQPGTNFNEPGSFDNFETKLELGMNLYAGGAHQLAAQMAEHGINVSQLQQDLVKQQLTATTLQTLLGIEGAQQQLKVNIAAMVLIDAQINDVQKHIAAGTTLRSDLLSLQARRSEAHDTKLQAEYALQTFKAALAMLLNIDPDDLPQLTTSGDDLRNRYCDVLPEASQVAVKLAQLKRPEFQSATMAAMIAKLNVQQVTASSAPQVNLFGQGWVDQQELGYDDSDLNYSIGIMVDFNLLDGGSLSARELAARAQLSAATSTARLVQNQVANETRNAFSNLLSAKSRVEVAAAGIAQAAESLRLVKVQYENNVATVTRFLEAEQMNFGAQLRLIQANLDLQSAQIELTRATSNFINI